RPGRRARGSGRGRARRESREDGRPESRPVRISRRKEKTMQHGRNRKVKALATAFAVAAFAAPAAQASIDTDATHQALVDKVQQAQVDARHQALLRHGEQGPVVY